MTEGNLLEQVPEEVIAGTSWGAQVKLYKLAQEAIRLLKERGDMGIRSDELADLLATPKRRVYDVIAILKALNLVSTIRRYDGTMITWIDQLKEYIPRSLHEATRQSLDAENEARKVLQVEVAELKEQLRITRMKIRRDTAAVEAVNKTEFNTTQIRVRPLSRNGFKRVKDSGMEVIIETDEPGMLVDPTEIEYDENESLIKNLQRI